MVNNLVDAPIREREHEILRNLLSREISVFILPRGTHSEMKLTASLVIGVVAVTFASAYSPEMDVGPVVMRTTDLESGSSETPTQALSKASSESAAGSSKASTSSSDDLSESYDDTDNSNGYACDEACQTPTVRSVVLTVSRTRILASSPSLGAMRQTSFWNPMVYVLAPVTVLQKAATPWIVQVLV